MDAAYLDDLNPPQREAVERLDGPLLVVAGAGSGKTRVLTFRIAHLMRTRDVRADRILAITFTNKAAAEMRERVEQLVGIDSSRMWVMTFHAACGRILRAEADRIGIRSNFTIYDQGDQVRLVKQVLGELDLDPKRFPPSSIHHRISDAKNQLITPSAYRSQVESFFQETVADVYERYDQRLYDNNAVDFDDMIMKSVHLLEQFPDAREKWQSRFDYVLVDEYQDTNHAQYRLLRALADTHQNICCVGDADQSIYSWRGADIRNILQFEEDFPDAHVVVLDQNYRSSQNILDTANALIQHGVDARTDKKLWSDLGNGPKVRVEEAEDEHAEARVVTARIGELMSRGTPASDIAVFYRTNAQSRVLEDQLLRQQIDYQVIGGPKFYDRAEVKDAIAYLNLIQNPADGLSLERIVNRPRRGIGQTTIDRLRQWADMQAEPLWNACCRAEEITSINKGATTKVLEFARTIESLREYAGRAPGIAHTIEAMFDQTGLIAALQAEDTIESEGRIENLGELVGVAREFDMRNPTGDLRQFLQAISLQSDADQHDSSAGRVTLMTLHNAKGLEFPAVFITGLEEGLLPHSRSAEEGNLDEERRLLYVGITRAQQQLTILHARARTIFGRRAYSTASRFLEELPDGSIERIALTAAGWAPSRPAATGGWAGSSSGSGSGGTWDSPTSTPARHAVREMPTVRVGDNVRHAKFGEGVIMSLEQDGELAVIRFADDGAERRLMLAYAPLEKS